MLLTYLGYGWGCYSAYMVIYISERTLSGCYIVSNIQFERSNDIVLFVFQSEGKLFSSLVSDKSSVSSATQPSKLSKRETLKVLPKSV